MVNLIIWSNSYFCNPKKKKKNQFFANYYVYFAYYQCYFGHVFGLYMVKAKSLKGINTDYQVWLKYSSHQVRIWVLWTGV